MPVITLTRPVPTHQGAERSGWTRDRRCRVTAGCYETESPVREVYVPDQIGTIEGWSFAAWDGTTPTAATLYVRVTL